MRLVIVAVLGLVSFGSGCAIKNVQLLQPPAGQTAHLGDKARVVVLRPSVVGFAIGFEIKINGVEAGTIRSHDYVDVLVPPGTVRIETAGETETFMTFPAEAGHIYYVQTTPKMGWWIARVQLELLDPKEGAELVTKCENHTREDIVYPETTGTP